MDIKKIMPQVVLSLAVLGYIFLRYFKFITAYTQDLGRHLLTGKIILEQWSVPGVNLYSYTHPGFPFINHHFLFEVIIYLIYTAFGNNGIQILSIITILTAYGIVFFYSSKKYSYLIVSAASVLYLGILFERTDIRPEMISYLFLAIFMAFLFKNREKHSRWIYLLPIIMVVWVNTHIYFFVGIVTVALFLIDAFLQRKAILKPLLLCFGLCICATLFNPNFITGAIYPLNVFNNYGYQIEENQSVFFLESLGFQKNSVVYLKIASFFLFILLFVNYKRARAIDWLLAITFTFAAFIAVRNLPLFVFATIIPFTKSLFEVCEDFLKRFFKKYDIAEITIATLITGIFLWQSYVFINNSRVGFGVEYGAERAVDFFITNNIRGPIFNNFDIGSYLLYRLYPTEKVFIDGRPEAYPSSFIQNVYKPMQESSENFKAIDKEYGFEAIFFSHTDMTPWAQRFLSEIVKSDEWSTVYLDDTGIILVKKNGLNKDVFRKYGMNYPSFKYSEQTDPTIQGQLKLANFFQTSSAVENQIEIYKKILLFEPTHCPALYNLATLLIQKNDPSAQVIAIKYQNLCER